MFGYVKPDKAELLVKEYEFYRATYCGVCRAMKHNTGALSNATLSYDSVFLALTRMLYEPDGNIGAKPRRCIAHPMKKRPMLNENEALAYTAKAFSILTYYKLADDLHDEALGKRLVTGAARPITATAKRRAALPQLEEVVSDRLLRISELEAEQCPSVDNPATLFGELLGEVFTYGLPDRERLVPYRLGYHLGRFIYAADAAEDYDKDRRSGSYNPFVLSYGGAELTRENKESIKCALLLECKSIEGALNLLPFGNRATIENILRNIIYLGLPKRIGFLDGDSVKENSI